MRDRAYNRKRMIKILPFLLAVFFTGCGKAAAEASFSEETEIAGLEILPIPAGAPEGNLSGEADGEIGRASCRERV